MSLSVLGSAGKMKGNMQRGYFGIVSGESFITPSELTVAVGLTAGMAA